jgi:acetylornithine aminotransferase
MIALGPASYLFQAGDHGSTFGGNPIATAAALAVLSSIEKEKILNNVNELSSFLFTEISLIPGVIEVRGAGLLLGIELDKPVAKNLVKKCQELGLLINAPGDTVIRIAPALNISMRDAKKFISIFTAALKEVGNV